MAALAVWLDRQIYTCSRMLYQLTLPPHVHDSQNTCSDTKSVVVRTSIAIDPYRDTRRRAVVGCTTREAKTRRRRARVLHVGGGVSYVTHGVSHVKETGGIQEISMRWYDVSTCHMCARRNLIDTYRDTRRRAVVGCTTREAKTRRRQICILVCREGRQIPQCQGRGIS